MASHSTLSAQEAADRLAIRELFDAYAHCADTRDAEGQKALFTDRHPLRGLHGRPGHRAELRARRSRGASPVFDDLNRYEATMHFNGQSTVIIDGDRRPATATPSRTTSTPKTAPA